MGLTGCASLLATLSGCVASQPTEPPRCAPAATPRPGRPGPGVLLCRHGYDQPRRNRRRRALWKLYGKPRRLHSAATDPRLKQDRLHLAFLRASGLHRHSSPTKVTLTVTRARHGSRLPALAPRRHAYRKLKPTVRTSCATHCFTHENYEWANR